MLTSLIIVKRVGTLIKLIVSLTLGTYAVGFLISTIYFSHYKIMAFSLFKPQYVLAGIWAVIPILLALVFGYIFEIAGDFIYDNFYFASNFIDAMSKVGGKKRAVWSLLSLSAKGLILVARSLISVGILQFFVYLFTSEPTSFACYGWINIGICGFLLSWKQLFQIFNKVNSIEDGDDREKAKKLSHLFVILQIVSAAAYLQIYTTTIHRYLPATLGGGKPIIVAFLLRPDFDASKITKMIVKGKYDGETRPYSLLLETEKAYYILARDSEDEWLVFCLPHDTFTGYVTKVGNDFEFRSSEWKLLESSPSTESAQSLPMD